MLGERSLVISRPPLPSCGDARKPVSPVPAAKLAQRAHELLEAAVVDVLEQDRAAVEDDVAAEQAPLPRVLEQEREMPARVAGRVDALDDEVSDRDAIALRELGLDGARF